MITFTQTASFAWRDRNGLAVARICVSSALLLGCAARPAVAQQQGGPDGTARRVLMATRTAEIQPGDRIIVVTRGDSTRVDTVTVQSDGTIAVANIPPIRVDTVTRSELQSYLSHELHQYVKRDLVRATPLVAVGVLGEVVHPGYYRVPLQITVGDLLMVAGGPSPQADLTRVRVRRGQSVVVDEHRIRDAMVRGLALVDLGIDAGDEVVLTSVPQRNWVLIAQLAGAVTGLALTLHTLKVF